jgi:hypothetical protein
MSLKNNIKYDDLIFIDKCGCHNCRKIFSPDKITTCVFDDAFNTDIAVCPFCDCATVVGDINGTLNDQSLKNLHDNNSNYYQKISQ